MNRFFCDLHLHSCLSPCGDDESTPGSIAGMASLMGLQIAALTDHNSAKNCPAFFALAPQFGVIPVAGMELTTAEDVHILCLFRTLADALAFDAFLDDKRFPFKNKPDIFGRQLICSEDDEIVGEEENLLINAVALSIAEAHREVTSRSGVALPAHIDRRSNGIITMLGDFPPEPAFTAYELRDGGADEGCRERFPLIRGLSRIVSSDAHRLEDMREAEFGIDLDADPSDPQSVRDALIDWLLQK